jgi:hypothetical protein
VVLIAAVEVTAQEEGSFLVQEAGEEESRSTRQRITFLHVSSVAGPITLYSSVINALILPTWEKISLAVLHNLMELIGIGMQTLVLQIMSPENLTS